MASSQALLNWHKYLSQKEIMHGTNLYDSWFSITDCALFNSKILLSSGVLGVVPRDLCVERLEIFLDLQRITSDQCVFPGTLFLKEWIRRFSHRLFKELNHESCLCEAEGISSFCNKSESKFVTLKNRIASILWKIPLFLSSGKDQRDMLPIRSIQRATGHNRQVNDYPVDLQAVCKLWQDSWCATGKTETLTLDLWQSRVHLCHLQISPPIVRVEETACRAYESIRSRSEAVLHACQSKKKLLILSKPETFFHVFMIKGHILKLTEKMQPWMFARSRDYHSCAQRHEAAPDTYTIKEHFYMLEVQKASPHV